MKKLITVILLGCLIIVNFPLSPTFANNDTYVITPDIGVNLREQPTKDSNIVAKLKQGYRVEKIEDSNEWMKVSHKNNTGYIMKEYTKPLDKDLLAAYGYYGEVLKDYHSGETSYTYTLLYDFNQDGQEELYIAYSQDDPFSNAPLTFRHIMYDGKTLVFDEILEEGLDIYWDDFNYYIVTNVVENRGGIPFSPNELNIDLVANSIDTNISITGGKVIRPGNLKVIQDSYSNTWVEVIGYYSNDEWYEYPTEEKYLYRINDKPVTEAEFNKYESVYVNAPSKLTLYTDILGAIEENPNFKSNIEETKAQLSALAEQYNPSKVELPYSKEEIDKINNYLQNTLFEEINLDSINYYNLFSLFQRTYLTTGTIYGIEYFEAKPAEIENIFDGEVQLLSAQKISHEKVDQWIYETYGIRMNHEQLKKQIEEAKQQGSVLIEVEEDSYICYLDGLGSNLPIIKLKNVHILENDYIAIEFNSYPPSTELFIDSNADDHRYILVKKVTFADGQIYYPYIKHTDTIDNIDYAVLDNYADKLDVVKEYKEEFSLLNAPTKEDTNEEASPSNMIWIISGGFIVIILVAVGIFITKRKK